MSADQHNVNSSMDRRREERERIGEQFAKEGQENLHKIATGGLNIWQSYLDLGTSMAQAWVDNLHNVKSSLEQMANSAKDQDQDRDRSQRRAG